MTTDWYFKGMEFTNCNCDYSCPCQFNVLPTHGDCQAVMAYQIDEGRFGDVVLDGLRMIDLVKWPKAIHEGNGTMQVIIDARADEPQREALRKILHGEETEPGATVFSIFHSTMTNILEPVYKDIDLTIDVEARRGRIAVGDCVKTEGEPIRNPVTGDEHRIRIDLPNGFDFTLGEVASATSEVTGELPMNFENSFGLFAHIHTSNRGVVRQ